jgi:glyceraldehyde 3-phosphate dehydrogenase
MPALEGRMDGMAMRVPIPDGSVTDLVCILDREVTVDEINEAFVAAANGPLKNILEVTDEPIVSIDIVGNPHSCVLDSLATMASGNLVKTLGWYDNEWGYSNRLAELVVYVGERL